MSAVSYQGISDHVAYSYMVKHGRATWCGIKRGLDRGASCPKLKSYWHFHDCRYDRSVGRVPNPSTSGAVLCRNLFCETGD